MGEKERMKKRYARLAPKYDLLHHLQTARMDEVYRRRVAQSVDINPGDMVLDVATGTGRTALKALAEEPGAYIVGTDLTYEMLQEGKKNTSKYANFSSATADIENLPYKDDSFDVVLSTYGIGGIREKDKAFEEIVRVARPYAEISAIEMCSPPEDRQFKNLLHKNLTREWVNKLWKFQDTDLPGWFEKYDIEIKGNEYLDHLVFGSNRVVYGKIRK